MKNPVALPQLHCGHCRNVLVVVRPLLYKTFTLPGQKTVKLVCGARGCPQKGREITVDVDEREIKSAA